MPWEDCDFGHSWVSQYVFLIPPLPFAGVGHIRYVTSVCAYVTFVTRFKFTCKFRCKFTLAFLLQLITFIPSGLESWNFVWHLPTSRPFNVWYRCPRFMPLGGARDRGGGICVRWTHFYFFFQTLTGTKAPFLWHCCFWVDCSTQSY